MNTVSKLFLTMAVLGLTISVAGRAWGEVGTMEYGRPHETTHGGSMNSMLPLRSSQSTQTGGGTYHYEQDFRWHNRATLDSGSNHSDSDLYNPYMRSHRIGSTHARRSLHRTRPRDSWNAHRMTRTTLWFQLSMP